MADRTIPFPKPLSWQLQPISRDEWLAAWLADPERTRFGHPDWHGLFAETWPDVFTPCAYRIIGPDGTDAVLPGCTRRLLKGLAAEWTGSPGHTYGGLIGTHTVQAYREAQSLLLGKHASYVWNGNPFQKSGSIMGDFTQVLDLKVSDEELDRTIDHYKNLYFARRAERQGLRLDRWTDGAQAYDAIYHDARNRWESATGARNEYPGAFFRALFDREGTEVWAVRQGTDPHPLAMGVFLTAGSHVVSWLTLARKKSLELRPYQFLYVNLIRHYKAEGYRWFDFNPSGGLGGVIEFKSRFGTKRLFYPTYRGQRAWMRLLRTVRRV